MAFAVAMPTWGVGTGGTRFARFPGPGEPRNVFDKLDDCAVINRLPADADGLAAFSLGQGRRPGGAARGGASLGLGFDAVNSNTFQDQPGQALSYKFGTLTHTDTAVREQAIAHNIDCIDIGMRSARRR